MHADTPLPANDTETVSYVVGPHAGNSLTSVPPLPHTKVLNTSLLFISLFSRPLSDVPVLPSVTVAVFGLSLE